MHIQVTGSPIDIPIDDRKVISENDADIAMEIEIGSHDHLDDYYEEPIQEQGNNELPLNCDNLSEQETLSEVSSNYTTEDEDGDLDLAFKKADFQLDDRDFILTASRLANFTKSKTPAASLHIRQSLCFAMKLARQIIAHSSEPNYHLKLAQKAFNSDYFQKVSSDVMGSIQECKLVQADGTIKTFHYIPIENTLKLLFEIPEIRKEIEFDHTCKAINYN